MLVELVHKIKFFYLTPINLHFSSVIVIVTSLLNTVPEYCSKLFVCSNLVNVYNSCMRWGSIVHII